MSNKEDLLNNVLQTVVMGLHISDCTHSDTHAEYKDALHRYNRSVSGLEYISLNTFRERCDQMTAILMNEFDKYERGIE